MPQRVRDVAFGVIGSVCVVAALCIIWAARFEVGRDVYVSELGATGAPTAKQFELALLLIVVGGSLIAFVGRGVRSRPRILAAWTPAVSLWIACGLFLVASQVTCTAGCPPPYGPTFSWQDLTHVFCATMAFVASCWAMLQTAFAREHLLLAGFSLALALAVGVISGLGGIMSLARLDTNLGARFELTATTLAIAWVVVFGVFAVVARLRQRVASSSSSRLASPTSM